MPGDRLGSKLPITEGKGLRGQGLLLKMVEGPGDEKDPEVSVSRRREHQTDPSGEDAPRGASRQAAGDFTPRGGLPVSGDALLISAGEEMGSPLESREERPGMSCEAQEAPPTKNDVIQNVNHTQLSNSRPILFGGWRQGPA